MNWPRLIVRAIFLLLTVSLLIYLNVKASDDMQKIAEFKLNQLKAITSDSLNARQKFERAANETIEFSEEIFETSSRVREGVSYLTLILALLIVSEIFFSVRSGRVKNNLE